MLGMVISSVLMDGFLVARLDASMHNMVRMLLHCVVPLVMSMAYSRWFVRRDQDVLYVTSRSTNGFVNYAHTALRSYMRNNAAMNPRGGTYLARFRARTGYMVPCENSRLMYPLKDRTEEATTDGIEDSSWAQSATTIRITLQDITRGIDHSSQYIVDGQPLAVLQLFMEQVMRESRRDTSCGMHIRANHQWIFIPTEPPRDELPISTVCQRGMFDDYAHQLELHGSQLFRRGYMLHGPPGSGKTNTAILFARHFGLDVHIMTKEDLASNPLEALSQILHEDYHENFVVLFEDIERDSFTVKKDDEQVRATNLNIQALMNALGGATAIRGMIAIFTTNDLEFYRGQEALMRPGRIASVMRVGGAEPVQIRALLEQHKWGTDRITEFQRACSASIMTPTIDELIHALTDGTTPELLMDVIAENRAAR